MLSARYALPVSLILSVALIPTVIHNYFGSTDLDSRSVQAIEQELGRFSSHPTKRNPNWGELTFGASEWIERSYQDGVSRPVRLFAARAFDHKRLYHHPELALSYGGDFDNQGLIILPGEPRIPVRILRSRSGKGLVAYALHYQDRFIDNPILHQIQESLKLLISPRKPITLFYVSDAHTPVDQDFQDTPTAMLLQKTIADFLAQPE
ncbi:MAG TPA: hypothetical protein DCZ48_13120 [Methylococcaceae bacterium]|nr:hypothetical protein [Methylococcaceae bacterium]